MGIVSYIRQGDKILIGHEGQTYTVGPDHINYTRILEAIEGGRRQELPELADVVKSVNEYTHGSITIDADNETVSYDGKEVHNVICDRLIDLMRDGQNVDPLIMFLENLLDNPSQTAIDEMYLFMEANNMSITPDGHFLAYKNVRGDYTDIHSGKFDNSVGQVVEMDRDKVDPVRNRTCSYGLHFCGLSYLNSFRGEHTMIVKINPRDVVSIPSDYNNAKGRCCRYEVVGEHTSEERYEKEAFNTPVVEEYSEIAPTVEDIRSYKAQSGERSSGGSFFKDLFNWMSSSIRRSE